MTDKLVILDGDEPNDRTSKLGPINNDPVLGGWYWLKIDAVPAQPKYNIPAKPEHEVLVCCMHIGSNYVEVQTPWSGRGGSSIWRIHLENFWTDLRLEPDAALHINREIAQYQQHTQFLLAKVQEITQRLGMAGQGKLNAPAAPSENALVIISEAPDIKKYEGALIRAKEEELPALFQQIKLAHEDLAAWMKAPAMSMVAKTGDLQAYIKDIDSRIFSVSLYAGLTEKAVKVAKGKPAAVDDKLHIMQRMLFMDEESLLGYKHGGMDFDSIKDFDRFIADPDNRDRILPFPRTLVAFRVRRHRKEREFDGTLSAALVLISIEQADKSTFFYVRNGEQIWRIDCAMNFPELIFPTRDQMNPLEPKMFKHCSSNVEFMPIPRYEEFTKEKKANQKEIKKWTDDWTKKHPKENSWGKCPIKEVHYSFRPDEWKLFSPASVYYDDAMEQLDSEMREYNRISLIIQGLFDRSEVLHPHLPVKTWTQSGFEAAIKLVSDGDANLYYGEAPDFEAYRVECNKTLKTGSIVVGQKDFWQRKEADKENLRRANSNSRYEREARDVSHFTPDGDPGPADPGPVARMNGKMVVFRWSKERKSTGGLPYWKAQDLGAVVEKSLQVPTTKLFNVDAYKLGDFKRFFRDPRTRQQYLKWAPMLLAAEEWCARVAGLPFGQGRVPEEPGWTTTYNEWGRSRTRHMKMPK